jgi:broad specificity phosphatase PhoE
VNSLAETATPKERIDRGDPPAAMNGLPMLSVARQGETLWSRSGGAETLTDVRQRAERVITRVCRLRIDVQVSSAHRRRVLAACWLGIGASYARHFYVGTTSLRALGHEHALGAAATFLWNDTAHLSHEGRRHQCNSE